MAGIDDYRSKNNRQDLDVVMPEQAYGEAKARECERRRQQELGNDPYMTIGVDSAEMADWRTIQRYEHNKGIFSDISTMERGDGVEPKKGG